MTISNRSPHDKDPMSPARRALLTAAFFGFAAIHVGAQAQEGAFETLPVPQATSVDGKIEVIEFFWYGCDHCYRLEPAVHAWLEKKPADVEFKRIPAGGSERWTAMTRLYYSLEAMGQIERLHPRIFDAIHKDRIRFDQPQARDRWLATNGIAPEKYAEMEKSFGVQAKTQRAIDLTRAYRVDGVPALAVGGKYVTSPSRAGGGDKAFEVVNQLVARIRAETRPAGR